MLLIQSTKTVQESVYLVLDTATALEPVDLDTVSVLEPYNLVLDTETVDVF